ncbi:MAG: choice-of-anchor Q domain-containing protein [Thermomicrobiales bacterium]
MSNSTVSGNSATTDGGAIFNSGGITEILTHVTIAANNSGIWNVTATTLKSSILANTGANCTGFGTLTDGHYNLVNDNSCGLSDPTDLTSTNPLLNPLAVNAPGATATHALMPGSPAIDRIPVASGSCNATGVTADQREVTRPQPAGGNCDIGAYDYTPFTPTMQATTVPVTGGAATFTCAGFQTGTTVSIAGGAPITPTSIAPDGTAFTANLPAHGAGVVTATVTNPGGLTGTAQVTYTPPNALPQPKTPGTTGGMPGALPPVRQPTVVPSGNPNPLPNPRP